jgi:hypothetical protein
MFYMLQVKPLDRNIESRYTGRFSPLLDINLVRVECWRVRLALRIEILVVGGVVPSNIGRYRNRVERAEKSVD